MIVILIEISTIAISSNHPTICFDEFNEKSLHKIEIINNTIKKYLSHPNSTPIQTES